MDRSISILYIGFRICNIYAHINLKFSVRCQSREVMSRYSMIASKPSTKITVGLMSKCTINFFILFWKNPQKKNN